MFVSCLAAQPALPCTEGDGEAAALFSLQVARACFQGCGSVSFEVLWDLGASGVSP